MTQNEMVDKLTRLFNSEKYENEQLAELTAFCSSIPEEDRERVTGHLSRHRKWRSPIMVAEIRESCSEMGVLLSGQKSEQKVIPLVCEACETSYQFQHAVTDEEETRGLHCRCPKCGLPGSDQLTAHGYARMDGNHLIPTWFRAECEHFRDQKWESGSFYNAPKHEPLIPIPVIQPQTKSGTPWEQLF